MYSSASDPSRMTFEQAVRRADAALYEAKQGGRNRFELSKADAGQEKASSRTVQRERAETTA